MGRAGGVLLSVSVEHLIWAQETYRATQRGAALSEVPPHPQDHLQDCLPPQPRGGPRQASLRLLPRLEEGHRAPGGLRGR